MSPATSPALEMPIAVPSHMSATPSHFNVWTVNRVLPLIFSGAVGVLAVAIRPNVTGSLIAVGAEICLMVWLVKTWLVR